MQYKKSSKILSLLLTVCMILTMIPFTAAASETPTSITIAAFFDALLDEILFQGYDYGEVTSPAALTLPNTLTGKDTDDNPITIEGVTWQSEPAFDPAVSAWYNFSPTLPEGYILAEGVTAPVISVFIRPEGGVQIQPLAVSSVTVGGVNLLTGGTVNGANWNGVTNTLTLDAGSYGAIFISSNENNPEAATIDVTGEVTVTSASGNAIYCTGSLTIQGIGSLTATTTGAGGHGIIVFRGSIIINVPTTATGGDNTSTNVSGGSGITAFTDITINAKTTAEGGDNPNGSGGTGISAYSGKLEINAETHATGGTGGSGTETYYGNGIDAYSGITVNAATTAISGSGSGVKGNLTVSDGVVEVNGDISGNLTVSSPTADVTVNGDVSGNLDVSDGTVDVTGTVSGATTVTGGNVTVSGQVVPAATYDYTINLANINTGAVAATDGYIVSSGGTGNQLYLNQAGKSYRVFGATSTYGLWIGSAISLTLDGVTLSTNENDGLLLGADVDLTLIGANSLTGSTYSIGGYGSYNFTIGGTGSLTAPLNILTTRAFTINGGAVNTDWLSADTIEITGGAVNAASGGGDTAIKAHNGVTISGGTVSGINTGYAYGIASDTGGGVTITGGSVYAKGVNVTQPINPQPTNGSGTTLYMTTLAGLPANTAVTAMTAPSGYGFNDMYTDAAGKLYLWLPEGSQTIAFTAGAANINKTFTIAANNSNLFAAVDVNTNATDGATLKAALEKDVPSTITVAADITLTEQVTMGASHTLVIGSGRTVTYSGNGRTDIGSYALTINGGGTFVAARAGGHALYGSGGTLHLEDITVNLNNSSSGGISVKTLNIGSGATVTLDTSATGHELITVPSGYTCTVNAGGKIDIKNFGDDGLDISGGTLHINGGTVTVGTGQSWNRGISVGSGGTLKLASGSLTGETGSMIWLQPNVKITGMNGKLSDQNQTFTASGEVTVGDWEAASSVIGLSAGPYYWNGSVFAKHAITISTQPQNTAVTAGAITGSLSVAASASNSETVSYQWWETNDGGWSSDLIPGATNSTFSIPTSLTAGTYYYYCVLSADKCADVDSAIVTVTVNPAGVATYTATLNIKLDGAPFTSQAGGYTLKLDGNESTTYSMTGLGLGATRTANVPNGTWKVYEAMDDYTGVNITVNNGPASATLDYYTGSYSVSTQGAAISGSISISINGNNYGGFSSGTIFFIKGDNAIFTATGAGAASYTYAWSGTHNGAAISGTGNTYTIPSVQGIVNITCTITGSTEPPVTHTIAANAGANGTISPSGSVSVNNGESKAFTITANGGYVIGTVVVDGTNVPTAVSSGSYTFYNVTADHTIVAAFKPVGGGQTITINTTVNHHVYGNGDITDNGKDNSPTTPLTDPNDNTVNIGSSGVVDGFSFVYGSDFSNYSGSASASGNTVTVSGTVTGSATGSYVYSYPDSAEAIGSAVTVNGGSVYAAFGCQVQSNSDSATVSGNTVTVTGGSVASTVSGGNATGYLSAAATGNGVVISGGTFGGDIYGGYASTTTGTGEATGNTVTISGGTFGAGQNIYGGYVFSNDIVSATGNTVTISGAPALSGCSLFGGANSPFGSASSIDVFTGNTLNLHSAIVAAGVENFANLNFYLPTNLTAGGTMLTMTTPTDLTGVTVNLAFTKAPDLAVGNVITLINNVTGTFTNKNVTVSGYTFALSLSSGKVIATVTAVPGSDNNNNNDGNGGSSDGSGGGTASSVPRLTVTDNEIKPVTNTANGVTTAKVSDINVNTALDNALKSAEKSGGKPNVIINVPAGAGANTVSATISKESVKKLADTMDASLTLKQGVATLTFSNKALKGISEQTTGDITFTVSSKDKVTLIDEQKAAAGDRPIYELTVTSVGKIITDFKGGVTVTIPYTLKAGENANAVVAYYLTADGKLQIIENGVYDLVSKTVSFTVEHFSLYVIGYNLVTFKDVKNGYWGKAAIDFAAARALVSGVGNGNYDPERAITRAEFVQMVQNVLKLPAGTNTSGYVDIAESAWYYNAVMAAKKAGLFNGLALTDNQFLPDQGITRQEMAVILANVAVYKNMQSAKTVDLTKFKDYNAIKDDYLKKLQIAIENGFMNEDGIGGGIFDPEGLTTRAQAAQVQKNLLNNLWK